MDSAHHVIGCRLTQELMDSARRVLGCRSIQETRAPHASDDVATCLTDVAGTIDQSLNWGSLSWQGARTACSACTCRPACSMGVGRCSLTPRESRVESAWFLVLKLRYHQRVSNFCFLFQLATLHGGVLPLDTSAESDIRGVVRTPLYGSTAPPHVHAMAVVVVTLKAGGCMGGV